MTTCGAVCEKGDSTLRSEEAFRTTTRETEERVDERKRKRTYNANVSGPKATTTTTEHFRDYGKNIYGKGRQREHECTVFQGAQRRTR